VAVLGAAGCGGGSTALTGVVRLTAAEDAYVNQERPDQNYGSAAVLRVDGSPVVRAYLRFDLGGRGGAPTSARLRITPASDSDQASSASPGRGGRKGT